MGKLVSLGKLFKLPLTQRLPSYSLSEPLNRAKDRGDVLHRVHVELLASLGKNRCFCTPVRQLTEEIQLVGIDGI